MPLSNGGYDRSLQQNDFYAGKAFSARLNHSGHEWMNACRDGKPDGELIDLAIADSPCRLDGSLGRIQNAYRFLAKCKAGIQMDLYHTQMEQGNLASLIQQYINEITYVQIASVPGRHEPTVGEINYRYLLELLQSLDFRGWIGCEYIPRHATDGGLSWARDWGLLNNEGSPHYDT